MAQKALGLEALASFEAQEDVPTNNFPHTEIYLNPQVSLVYLEAGHESLDCDRRAAWPYKRGRSYA
jgi:hypothetical protein